jgi:hypothetical protein
MGENCKKRYYLTRLLQGLMTIIVTKEAYIIIGLSRSGENCDSYGLSHLSLYIMILTRTVDG